MKEDLLESFGCLRKDLKENEELKELISKVCAGLIAKFQKNQT